MFLAVSMSMINLFLYCTQQLGMTLGVGAETVLLVAYLHAMRDGTVDEKEQGFTRTARGVMNIGLILIIGSGLGVIATQIIGGTPEAFFSTIFLFKWSLIGIVLFFALGNRGSSLASEILQGIAAATWYALFVVHILAPDAGWLELGQLYGLWLVGFMLCWTVLVFALRGKVERKTTVIPSKAVAQPVVVIKPNKVVVPPKPVAVVPTQNIPAPTSFAPAQQTSDVAKATQPASAPPPVAPPPPPSFPPPSVAQAKPIVVSAPVAIPVPPPPVPPPPPPTPPKPAPPPPPPKPMPPPAPTPTAALTGLHVMPRSPEDIAKRKAM